MQNNYAKKISLILIKVGGVQYNTERKEGEEKKEKLTNRLRSDIASHNT